MSDYFNKTKESSWTLIDAHNNFTKEYAEQSTQQKLDCFHAFLKKQENPKIQSLL
ncbi:hypothetical protein BD408DRAFT_411427 [Parasitella parasitica]|nr:hypothetical protein BD408DRAFT_411427 [Parasitella parasitica]